jgi:hypothetical protein
MSHETQTYVAQYRLRHGSSHYRRPDIEPEIWADLEAQMARELIGKLADGQAYEVKLSRDVERWDGASYPPETRFILRCEITPL